jgi:iron complex outermembrane receptor protein
LLILPTSAFAEELDLPDDLFSAEEEALFQDIPSVYSASKYEQKITKAPSSISIVTAEEIKQYGYRTLADILMSLRGFFATNDRNYSYLGTRGFARPADYNTRVLLLVDGHRINEAVYDSATIGNDFVVDVDNIERVEVIRGPSSSLYGNNAFFGVINVWTKRGRDYQGVEVSGEYRTYDTYKTRLNYGNRFDNGIEMLLSGSYLDSQGKDDIFFKEFNDPSTNNGVAVKNDGNRFITCLGNSRSKTSRFEVPMSAEKKKFRRRRLAHSLTMGGIKPPMPTVTWIFAMNTTLTITPSSWVVSFTIIITITAIISTIGMTPLHPPI